MLAVPVSLIGTVAVMKLFGLLVTTFAVCLVSHRIVVDDTTVVLENVERT